MTINYFKQRQNYRLPVFHLGMENVMGALVKTP